MNSSANQSNISSAPAAVVSSTPSSSSSSAVSTDTLVFQSCVVIIAFVGLSANGLTLIAMTKSKQIANRKLLIEQLLVDFLTCVMLAITYILKFPRFAYTNNRWNYFVCVMFIDGESVVWILNNVSTANLVATAIESYIMIVHSVWHRNHYNDWMSNLAIAITWIYGVSLTLPTNLLSSNLINGQCIVQQFWPSFAVKQFRNAILFLTIYIIPVTTFLFCYSRIVFVVKRQMRNASVDGLNPISANQLTALKRQMTVVKTLIIIVSCFFVCWSPARWNFAAASFMGVNPVGNNTRYVTVFLAFVYVCLSPLLYAVTLDAIKGFFLKSKFRGTVWPTIASKEIVLDIPIVDTGYSTK